VLRRGRVFVAQLLGSRRGPLLEGLREQLQQRGGQTKLLEPGPGKAHVQEVLGPLLPFGGGGDLRGGLLVARDQEAQQARGAGGILDGEGKVPCVVDPVAAEDVALNVGDVEAHRGLCAFWISMTVMSG
jgi:hypothetical protein